MPIPPDYASEALYSQQAWFIHDVLEISTEHNRVVGLCDTTQLGVLVDAQRAVPGHPKHVPGAVIVQMTGTLGQLHAVYVLGLRRLDGWVGFGTHIKRATFHRLGVIGPPIRAELRATSVRNLRGTRFVTYAFTFTQQETTLYTSEQIAAWVRHSE